MSSAFIALLFLIVFFILGFVVDIMPSISHMLHGLQEAAAKRFDVILETSLTSEEDKGDVSVKRRI